mmetsp:Transcript_16162/g.29303  ORF Transcript_16162/g.29303 Transcript_16162/m.29303 type:complete len:133 (+) Transcript_16162:1011-1409(+)
MDVFLTEKNEPSWEIDNGDDRRNDDGDSSCRDDDDDAVNAAALLLTDRRSAFLGVGGSGLNNLDNDDDDDDGNENACVTWINEMKIIGIQVVSIISFLLFSLALESTIEREGQRRQGAAGEEGCEPIQCIIQ